MSHTLRSAVMMSLLCILAGARSAMAAPPPGLDPHQTTLPMYLLPDTASADGNLAEWQGAPAVTADKFKNGGTGALITPSADFAPALWCGRKQGGMDLYFLLIVKDRQIWSNDDGGWAAPDNMDLYLDFGRAQREQQDPQWYKKGNWANVPGMGQIAIRPQTLTSTFKVFTNPGSKDWKIQCAATPVEGGMAYEICVDAASALEPLKLTEMPACLGIDIGVQDLDHPLALKVAEWEGTSPPYRLFGDLMNHAFPIRYGMVSTQTVKAPEGEPLPKTLASLYGQKPGAGEVAQAIGKLPDEKLADLVYWAGVQGLALDESLVKRIFAADSPRAQEMAMANLWARSPESPAVRDALEATYKNLDRATPAALALANQLNERLAVGHRDALRQLLKHSDMTVFVTGCSALARVGEVDDVEVLQQAHDAAAAVPTTQSKDPQAQRQRAQEMQLQQALDELMARVIPIPIPTSIKQRDILAKNTDTPRMLPIDSNKVYDAAGLARRWTKDGPKELWRAEIGAGLTTVVEADGRVFALAGLGDKCTAQCFDAATGKPLWQRVINEKRKDASVTPVVDGPRVYFVSPAVTCLNASDGSVVWEETKAYRATEYSTPLVVGDVLYIAAVQPGAVVAVDKLTGKMLWSTPGDLICSPGSMAWQEIDGKAQLVLGAAAKGNLHPEVWGVDPKTGAVLWQRKFNGQWGLCPSPVVAGYRIILCSGHGPFTSECVQAYVQDGVIQTRLAWRRQNLQSNSHNTPAVYNGAIYGFGPGGLQCTNLEDGKLLWMQKWGTDRHLLLADGLLFISTEQGEIVMAEATTAGYKEFGRFSTGLDLKGNTQQMMLANGRLYVHGGKQVACFNVLAP